jgi:4-amino-4-deoxy-L-arabinose transferase-like glycosyltransferase
MSFLSLSQTMMARPGKAAASDAYGWLTVERGLYGLLALLAAVIRFLWLGTQPLTALEAGHAWSAWLAANGGQTTLAPAPDSPLLYTLSTLLFWASAPGDAIARLIPALCGIGVVVLLWYWRAWLGRTTTLLAALLLAFDPWLAAYSRLADSAMLSLFLGLLALTGLMQVANQESEEADASSWRTTTALAFGLLVVSGPQAWSMLVVLALFYWLCASPISQAWFRQSGWWVLVAGAAIVGATGWLARPEGLGAISTSLTVWLQQITGSDGTPAYPLSWLGWRLLLEQPLLLVFGLLGLAAYRGQSAVGAEAMPGQQGWLRFLTLWLLWGLLLALAPGRAPLSIGLLVLPLLFWAAYGLTLLVEQAQAGVAWRENALLISVLSILLISFTFWLAALGNSTSFDATLARTLLVILVLIFLILLAYTLWLDGRQTRLVVGALLALILFVCTISSNWQLNQRFDLAYPDGFFASYTNPDVRQLAANVQTLSAHQRGDAGELALQVEMVGTPDPVLGWYLRDMRNLSWVLAPGVVDGQSPPVVITLSDAHRLDEVRTESQDSAVNQLAASYTGSRYALRDHWLPATLAANAIPENSAAAELSFADRMQERLNTLWSARWRGQLRWALYREAPAIPPSDGVILWVMAGEGNP